MIDIIIPAYNAHSTIENTLMSIAMQTIKHKINVYIIDDASEYSYESVIDKFKQNLNINLLKLEINCGPGMARQYGIDNTNSEYIYFIDADDVFVNSNSLQKLYYKIIDYDVVYGYTFNEESNECVFNLGDLHSKLFRRKFLEDNNIQFNNSRYHEDNAFNSLVIIHNPKVLLIDNVVCFYSFNKNSVTHDSKIKQFERLEIYVDNMNYVIKKCKNDNCDINLIKNYIYTKYKYLNRVYDCSSQDEKKKIKKWLSKYAFTELINLLNKQQLDEIRNIID